MPEQFVLHRQPDGGEQPQIAVAIGGIASQCQQTTGKSEQSFALHLLHGLHAFFQQHMVSMPGGIGGDEDWQGVAHRFFVGRLFRLRTLDVGLEYLFEARIGNHKAIFAEEFPGCRRTIESFDAIDGVKIVGSATNHNRMEPETNASQQRQWPSASPRPYLVTVRIEFHSLK